MTSPTAIRSLKPWDTAGMAISTACILHCMVTPLLIIALPTLGYLDAAGEWPHIIFAGLALPIAGISLGNGYKRHLSKLPSVSAISGILMLWLALFIQDPHWLENAVASFGAAVLGIGHWLNNRLSCRCCNGGGYD